MADATGRAHARVQGGNDLIARRPPRPRPLALAALALVLGLVVGLAGVEAFLPAAGGLTVALAVAALARRERGLAVIAALAATGVGGGVLGSSAARDAERDCRHAWEAGERVQFTGLALGYLPAAERGSVRLRPQSGNGTRRCAWSGALRVWTEGPVRPGALYAVAGSWQPARTPGRAPRPPDRRGWVVAKRAAPLEGSNWTEHPFLSLRGEVSERLWRAYPRHWAPLAQALILGQRETLRPELYRRIARSGLAHLLAISGLHVGLLAAAFFTLARVARLPVAWARASTLLLTFSYVVFIGAPASAVRAAAMIGLWMLTRVLDRASSAFDVLGLTAVLLLLVRPWGALEPGFQLSFAGAAAVGYAHSEARRSRWLGSLSVVPRAAALSVLASAAAVLLTAPITAIHFGRVAPAAIVGNLVAIPLLALAMPALFLSALVSAWPALASWPAAAAVMLLQLIDAVATLLASLQWASLDVARPGLLPVFAYLILLGLGANALHGAWQRRRFILGFGVMIAVALSWPALKTGLGPNHLAVYVIDVGQGDAIAIATPRRHWLLVDAGPKRPDFDAGRRTVLPFLREQGARRVEAFLASHPDLDHVGGAPAILEEMNVQQVIGSGRVTGQVGQVAVLRWLADRDQTWALARAGSQLSLDGVELAFFHPDPNRSRSVVDAPNENSLVFLLSFGQFRMLFTGDAPGVVEDRLSREHGELIRAQVLKISHHGSATSTSRLFLDAVQPQLAVISVGRGNIYGHPSPIVLGRLHERGVELKRTDLDGTLVIEARRDGSWEAHSAAEGYW